MVDAEENADKPLPEIEELNRFRLDRDMSYERLAEDMSTRLGVEISWRTIHSLLTNATMRPYDRTLHKVRKYLDLVRKATA